MSNRTLIGDEILVLIFALWMGSKLRATEEQIVRAFHALGRRSEYRRFLSDYPFDEDGLSPKCEALSSGLAALANSGLISWDMDFQEITFNQPALLKRFDLIFGAGDEPMSREQARQMTAALRRLLEPENSL
jgi:hypothetical protein